MNLTKQQVKTHLFEEVECSDDGDTWRRSILMGYDADGTYRANYTWWKHCRLPKPKAKRLLTVKEIWGRTLIHFGFGMMIVSDMNGDNEILNRSEKDDSYWQSIEGLHRDGWRLADETLEYENATSLEVEA